MFYYKKKKFDLFFIEYYLYNYYVTGQTFQNLYVAELNVKLIQFSLKIPWLSFENLKGLPWMNVSSVFQQQHHEFSLHPHKFTEGGRKASTHQSWAATFRVKFSFNLACVSSV